MIITATPRAENALRNLNTSIMRCNNLAAFSKLTESSTAPRLEFDKLLMLSWNRAVFWRREYEDATGSRIASLLCILIVMLAASGAGAASKEAKAVDLAASPAAVAQCEYVANVKASARYIVNTASATPRAERLAIKRLRIRTHRKGGDTVLVTGMISGVGRASVKGTAYRCASANAKG